MTHDSHISGTMPSSGSMRILIKCLIQNPMQIKAISSQKERAPVILQGDFHASAAGKITNSGSLALENPVNVIMSGTLATGDIPFPSSYHSIESKPSQVIRMEQSLEPLEKNGFTVIDITPDKMVFKMFTWRPPQDPKEIDTMKPTHVYEIIRS